MGESLGKIFYLLFVCKSKAIPVQAGRGPEGSKRVRFPAFRTIAIWRL